MGHKYELDLGLCQKAEAGVATGEAASGLCSTMHSPSCLSNQQEAQRLFFPLSLENWHRTQLMNTEEDVVSLGVCLSHLELQVLCAPVVPGVQGKVLVLHGRW